jgi:N-acyl-phosphatidylethanolamine-hydrolysing phospholipase D
MTRAVERQQRRTYSYSYSYSYSSPLIKVLMPPRLLQQQRGVLSMNYYHQNQNIQRQQQQQQQQIQQQKRSYLFIPMSWPELKERAERWLEKTESRIIKVRLLNRQRLQQLQLQLRRRQLLQQQPQQQQQQQQGNNNQVTGDRDIDDENNVIVRPITITTTNSKIRIKYQGWKIRRKDQYVSWKSRRKDQYVRWKSRRRDQYVRWKDDRINNKKNNNKLLSLWGRKNILLEEYSKPEWFDKKTGYPLTSKDSTGQRYVNPWQSQSTNGVQSISTILEWQCQRFIRTMRRSLALPLLLSSSTTTSTRSLSGNNDNNNNNDNDNDNISPLLSQTIQPLPLLNPNPNPDLESSTSSNCNELYMTWIGHSTCFFQMRGGGSQDHQSESQNYISSTSTTSSYWSILTDPMFSTRASPYKNWIGIPRDVQPAYTIQDILNHQQKQRSTSLGQEKETETTCTNKEEAQAQALTGSLLDICCITHDHYDHMDMISVQELKDHVQLWIVPLGIADWLVERCSINRKQIIELEWWEEVRIRKNSRLVIIDDDVSMDNNTINDDNDSDNEILTITCCPASHWSGRTILDRNKRLWCSFAMSLSTSTSASKSAAALSSSSSLYEFESKSKSLLSSSNTNTNTNTKLLNIFFCGDTSYPTNFPLFHQIGDALGPFDLSCIPIGAYLPKEMNKDAHCDPYEALQIHNDIQSKHSIAIHWGSFNLGEEPLYEPPQLLYDAILKQEEESEKKKKQKQKQPRVDNDHDDDDDDNDEDITRSAVSSCPSMKFDILRHGESRKII